VNEKWGYINAQGKEVISLRFNEAKDFAVNGLAEVRENWETVYIDQHGQVVRIVDE
jgi:nucleoside 2-deoxyribosyltransferase